ncbi:chaperone protein dnaJ 6 [Bisporella sp. PMI_857]|nr:chaperone protein dnaJ 6 [Bisporella sp. PMI_857]
MAPQEEDLFDEEPPTVDPYSVLGVSKTATDTEIKSAYRKAALRNHPDKVQPEQKETAHVKFQELVFAYSILSDPVRRKRYDATGSTSEILDHDGFSWTDFYREQFADVVTSVAIEKFSKQYKGSIEEKDDVLENYIQYKGKWSAIYNNVMLSDPFEDEERFRTIIDEAIEKGEVEAFKAYKNETEQQKAKRMKAARKEAKEAEEYAEELGVSEKLFGRKGKKSKKDNDESGLAALIKSRQAERTSFLDNLEAKYVVKDKKAWPGQIQKANFGRRG